MEYEKEDMLILDFAPAFWNASLFLIIVDKYIVKY
jgi:hypothetical protein